MTVAVDLGRRQQNKSTKFGVCVAHMNGVCNGTLFCPGPGEGPKGQILLNIIKFEIQSQFQRF